MPNFFRRHQSVSPIRVEPASGATPSPPSRGGRRKTNSRSTPPPTRPSTLVNPSLCALPDEIIAIIYQYLEAYETSGTLQTPRHAFSLALTNTRFFNIFVAKLTKITPDISNDAPATLSHGHMLSLMRVAGSGIRELHLPRSSFPTLVHLPKLCPNIERLSLVEDRRHRYSTNPLTSALSLPLRSLSITNPSRATLRLLIPPPEELYLHMFDTTHFKELDAILCNPPRKLYIQSEAHNILCLLHMLKSLIKACPNIEDFTLKIPDISTWWELPAAHHDLADYIFFEKAMELFEKHRFKNSSRCRNLVLEGDAVALTRLAHPEATIEITNDKQTFVSDGDHIYAKKLPLWNTYLSQDLSKLTEVFVGREFDPQWKELLTGIHLTRAKVEDPNEAAFLELDVEVLEMPLNKTFMVDWLAFNRVREVRLIGLWELKSIAETVIFFQSLTRLLSQFQGKTIWIKFLPFFWLRRRHIVLRAAVSETEAALDRFEARGGDAGTVRALLARITWMRVAAPARVMVSFKNMFSRIGGRKSVASVVYDS